jgi:hypothetical protein
MKYGQIVLLILAGCAYNNPKITKADYQVERVVARDGCVDISNCQAFAHYRRIGDMFPPTPGRWFISNQGHACIVDDRAWTIFPDNEMYACQAGWRMYRQ